jgi:hypothetical protein
MKSAFKYEDDRWRSILLKRLHALQYLDDLTDYTGGSDAGVTSEFPAPTYGGVPGIMIPSSDGGNNSLDPYTFESVTSNPSLSSTPQSSLSMTGGAALNTVAANQQVYNLGNQSVVNDISSFTSAIGQFGVGIASLLQGQQAPPAGSTVVVQSQPKTGLAAMSSGTLLLLLGLGIVLVLFITKKE